MQKITIFIMLVLMAITASAKDIKTLVVTPQPRMNCENCENKIKNVLRFEKGVKEITTSLELQTVTIKYDADKTTVEKLLNALATAGYTPKEERPACCSCHADTMRCGDKKPCCGGGGGLCCPKPSTESKP